VNARPRSVGTSPEVPIGTRLLPVTPAARVTLRQICPDG
jgi:hypothetical protein